MTINNTWLWWSFLEYQSMYNHDNHHLVTYQLFCILLCQQLECQPLSQYGGCFVTIHI